MDTQGGREMNLLKKAGIYNSELFTVLPRNIDVNNLSEVLPEHQGMSFNRVFLWDSEKDLILFSYENFNKFRVHLPDKIKHYKLQRCVCSIYSLPKLQVGWMEELSAAYSLYVE